MTDPQPDLGTDEGDTCNRLGCDGIIVWSDCNDYDCPSTWLACPICRYGPDNEKEAPHDD